MGIHIIFLRFAQLARFYHETKKTLASASVGSSSGRAHLSYPSGPDRFAQVDINIATKSRMVDLNKPIIAR